MYFLKVSREVETEMHRIDVKAIRIPFNTIKEAYEFGKVIANNNTLENVFIYIAEEIDETYDKLIRGIEKDWYLDYENKQ